MYKCFVILVLSLVITACSGGDNSANLNTPNKNATNNANAGNTDNPLAITTPTPKPTTNNAPTLTPVYKAYCEASDKKDEAGIRRLYSADTLKEFAVKMKRDGIKTLVEFLSDDQASMALCEVRNEQINGDTAIAEVRTKAYPNWPEVIFVKENGEWKITNRRPEGSLK